MQSIDFIEKDNISNELMNSSSHDESNWLVSYADMMTLLCGFFIMLFSFSKIDPPKYEKISQEIAKKFGGKVENLTQQLHTAILNELKQANLDSTFEVVSDSSGIAIIFESALFFDTLSAEVSLQGKLALEKLVGILSQMQVHQKRLYQIMIEGHSDSRPVLGKQFPSNWELSGARAARVVRIFLSEGFKPQRLSAIAYADTHPLLPDRYADGSWNEAALAKNRRVVVRVLSAGAEKMSLPEQKK